MLSPEDKFRLEAEIRSGSKINAFINDPELRPHLDGLLHGFQNMWLLEQDSAKREELWYQARGLLTLIDSMQSVVNTGAMAAAQLASEKEQM